MIDTFPGEQCPHHVGSLGSGLVLAAVEFSDVLRGHETRDAVDVPKPEPLEFDKRPQRDGRVLDPLGQQVGELLGEVFVAQPIEPQHHVDAVAS